VQICRVGARRQANPHRVRPARVLLALAGAAILLANAAVAGSPPALAAPADQPPNVVHDPPDVAQARIKAWSPADGSEAVADFSPAVVPDNVGGLAIVVRQGAPVLEPSAPSQRINRTLVPLTLGVEMPDLVGSTRSRTSQLLARFALTSLTWIPADAGDEDTVTGQSPPAGTLVAFADPVVVSFTESVPVPNVLGLKVDEARRIVEAAGLFLGTPRRTGRVTDQQPPAQTLVSRESTVTVTLDTGVTVPNLVGLTVQEARQAAEQAGLVLETPEAAGRVIGQRPRAGRSVPRGKVVAVTVEPIPVLIVPNVVGMTVQRARKTLERAGLRLDAPDIDGDVIGQRPAAGSSAIPGTTVAVTIAVPPTADSRLVVAAGTAGLLAVGAATITGRRWRRRRWVAHHVRVTPTRDPGDPLRHGGSATPSWRVTVQSNPGPTIPAQARKVTHADTSR
jgi:beta-lactam-binding protein with PASTA domain